MEFYKWNDKFSVNLDEMDQQHKKFFQLLNQLYEYNQKSDRDPVFLDKLFGELFSYTIMHFAEEEIVLEQTGYPGLAQQIAEHRYFQHELDELRKKNFQNATMVPVSVFNFMRDWFFQHILETDKKYGEYFKNLE